MSSWLLVLLQVPVPVPTPEQIGSWAPGTIVAYALFALFATFTVAIGWLAKAYRDQTRENQEIAERYNASLLTFTQTLAGYVEVLKEIPRVIERHEKDTAATFQQYTSLSTALMTKHEDAMRAVLGEVRSFLAEMRTELRPRSSER